MINDPNDTSHCYTQSRMGQVNQSLPYQLKSLLDTDLYKLTMQQAVRQHFPDATVTYRFTHRDKDTFFSRACVEAFRRSLAGFKDISLTSEEKRWLATTCPYLKSDYLDFLEQYRFKPDQVLVNFTPVSEDGQSGTIEIDAKGLWVDAILWEVPMMACLSELYFCIDATDWDYHQQDENAQRKAEVLLQAGCTFSEFGTRRRRSYHTQDLVILSILKAKEKLPGGGIFSGTSNLHFAKKYNLTPVGTIAQYVGSVYPIDLSYLHGSEWFMGVAALDGYDNANTRALDLWEQTYQDVLLTALTDTFSTQAFFREFSQDRDRACRWPSLRQDSGDPLAFAPVAKAMYESIGIDHRTKSIIYSDSVTLDKALALKQQCDDIGFTCSFGIGTFLTNDFWTRSSGYKEKSRALNMVIKLNSVNGKPCVKISDDLDKNTGDPQTIELVKRKYGLTI